MPVEELYKKAYRLLKARKVTYLEGGLYEVVGEHGTYSVQVLQDGRLTCTCPGYQRRNLCSHIVAVMIRRASKSSTG